MFQNEDAEVDQLLFKLKAHFLEKSGIKVLTFRTGKRFASKAGKE